MKHVDSFKVRSYPGLLSSLHIGRRTHLDKGNRATEGFIGSAGGEAIAGEALKIKPLRFCHSPDQKHTSR